MSLLASLILFKRLRTLSDTSTTTLSTVTQSYVGLTGTAMTQPGEVGPGPFYLPPTVWFRTIKQRSIDGFLVTDEYGSCTVDPQKAEVIAPLFYRQQHWYRAIYPGETIYILGQLKTLSGHYTDLDKRQATLQLLGNWKKDHFDMLERFDKNGDGNIDQQELTVARKAAEAVIDDHHDYEYRQTASHIINQTDDGRPFIISSIPIETLLKRYSFWMMAHLVAWPALSVIALLPFFHTA
ncbi:MAG: EF-hand domain-containing protein [Leucothrix sp.]